MSPTTITRLTATLGDGVSGVAHAGSLAERDYVYVWVDGVHFRVRLEADRLCTLVMIGVRADGTKELIAVEDGYRESTDSWATVLRDLKRRGLRAPVVAVGDSALGFWAAVGAVWPETREQRCWVHRLANVTRQTAEAAAAESQAGAPRDHERADPRRGRGRASTRSRPSTMRSIRRPWPRCGATRRSC